MPAKKTARKLPPSNSNLLSINPPKSFETKKVGVPTEKILQELLIKIKNI